MCGRVIQSSGPIRYGIVEGGKSAFEIHSSPDDMKFRSCLPLFREAASENSDRVLFTKALGQFYRGQPDSRTLELLR